MLAGKKTYLSAALLGLATFAQALGWISQEQSQVILGLAGSLGLAALRAGISKGE
jgi:hypothetical protein